MSLVYDRVTSWIALCHQRSSELWRLNTYLSSIYLLWRELSICLFQLRYSILNKTTAKSTTLCSWKTAFSDTQTLYFLFFSLLLYQVFSVWQMDELPMSTVPFQQLLVVVASTHYYLNLPAWRGAATCSVCIIKWSSELDRFYHNPLHYSFIRSPPRFRHLYVTDWQIACQSKDLCCLVVPQCLLPFCSPRRVQL